MKTTIDLASAIREWTNGQLLFRASYYTGRGVMPGDLSAKMLEGIYQGLKRDVGQQEATNFARFVARLKDLSASAFIHAFERFWHCDCRDVEIQADGNQITGRGRQAEVEAFVLIANALGGSRMSASEIESASLGLKMSFLQDHKAEIGSELMPTRQRSRFW